MIRQDPLREFNLLWQTDTIICTANT